MEVLVKIVIVLALILLAIFIFVSIVAAIRVFRKGDGTLYMDPETGRGKFVFEEGKEIKIGSVVVFRVKEWHE